MTQLSFVALMEKANSHADTAEQLIDDPGEFPEHRREVAAAALIHATLSEAYARMASALVVNVTSTMHMTEQPPGSRTAS